MRRTLLGSALATVLVLSGCQGSSQRPAPAAAPVGPGPIPASSVVWALGGTVHVHDREIEAGGRVRAMLLARGRIYLLRSRSDRVLVTDGGAPRRTPWRAEELFGSADGRYLGFFDPTEKPWSTVVVDLVSGEEVVRDATGMGEEDDDLADLYEDAQPYVLGFVGDDLAARVADGRTLSWPPREGEPVDLDDEYVVQRDPGGGTAPPALVRGGRLVLPKDPYDATRRAHLSPDGSVALMGTEVFAMPGGRRLPGELPGRSFLLGGWTGDRTAYGLSFDRSAFGPNEVRVVTCRLGPARPRCEQLRTLRPPPHQLVLFPTGSEATDY